MMFLSLCKYLLPFKYWHNVFKLSMDFWIILHRPRHHMANMMVIAIAITTAFAVDTLCALGSRSTVSIKDGSNFYICYTHIWIWVSHHKAVDFQISILGCSRTKMFFNIVYVDYNAKCLFVYSVHVFIPSLQ